MIERNGKYYSLFCDECSNFAEEFEDFQEAVEYKKANGWRSTKIGEDWVDICPACIEERRVLCQEVA